MLQNGWDLGDFLQNDPRNRPYMGLEASHFIGEISTGMHSINILKEFERYIMIYPPLQRLFLQGPLKVLDLQGASDIIWQVNPVKSLFKARDSQGIHGDSQGFPCCPVSEGCLIVGIWRKHHTAVGLPRVGVRIFAGDQAKGCHVYTLYTIRTIIYNRAQWGCDKQLLGKYRKNHEANDFTTLFAKTNFPSL